MTMSKGTTIKLLIVAFILFVVFKPEKSKQIYEEALAKLNGPEVVSSADVETRLKGVVAKANEVMDKHEGELKTSPPPAPVTECKCGGTGEIVHGDGHKTPCTCESPCKCEKPKALFGEAEKADLEKFIETAVQKSFDNYVKEYRERAAAQQVQPTQQQIQPMGQMPQ